MSDRTTTVLYTHGGGRFGNQMLRFMHWIAWVEEHAGRYSVVNLPFWPYASLFAQWCEYPGCQYPLVHGGADFMAAAWKRVPHVFRHRLDWRLQHLLAGVAALVPGRAIGRVMIPDGVGVDMANPEFTSRISQVTLAVVSGWELACWAWLRKHQLVVRRLFQPRREIGETAVGYIARFRERHGLMIGLLIRRTDYRVWHSGRYFFPVETYKRWINELLETFADSRPCVLVVSDEAIDLEGFQGMPVCLGTGQATGTGHWVENFFALAACDIVVSPPSTFSGCAAFVGATQLLPLRRTTQTIGREQVLGSHLFSAATDPDFSCAVK